MSQIFTWKLIFGPLNLILDVKLRSKHLASQRFIVHSRVDTKTLD